MSAYEKSFFGLKSVFLNVHFEVITQIRFISSPVCTSRAQPQHIPMVYSGFREAAAAELRNSSPKSVTNGQFGHLQVLFDVFDPLDESHPIRRIFAGSIFLREVPSCEVVDTIMVVVVDLVTIVIDN